MFFKKVQALHDYVKFHYERGDYDNSDIPKYTAASFGSDSKVAVADYQLGYLQAQNDYYLHQWYHEYPQFLFTGINKVVKHKMQEVVDFIAGYNDFKKRHPL